MPITVVSFLGRGPYSPTGERRDYFQTPYQFPDWCSEKVPFFLEALMNWLKLERQQTPARLVILGTSGSMWDALLLRLAPNHANIEALWSELCQRVDQNQVAVENLSNVKSIISTALNIEVHAELIPPGQTKPDQAQILSALQRHVKAGDDVYLDVTHGYRHQPMLGLGAAALLTQARGATIADILYGAAEMRASQNDPVPVVSLAWLLDLLAASDSVERFRAGGSLTGLAKIIPDGNDCLKDSLDQTAFFLSTNQITKAVQAAQESRTLLQDAASDPVLDLVRPAMMSALNKIAHCKLHLEDIIDFARAALVQGDHLRSATLLSEAVTAASNYGIVIPHRIINAVRALRNAIVHANEEDINWPLVKDAMNSSDKMSRFLREHISKLQSSIKQHSSN